MKDKLGGLPTFKTFKQFCEIRSQSLVMGTQFREYSRLSRQKILLAASNFTIVKEMVWS